MLHSYVEFAIAENPPNRLDKAIFRDAPEKAALSRTKITRLIVSGAVFVDGRSITNPNFKVKSGAEITVELPPLAENKIVPQDIPIDLIFEDKHLIVVNKPAGMVVHPAPGSRDGTLVNGLLYHFKKDLSELGGRTRPGIVHRLDKDTSGLIVIAKTDKAHQSLATQFASHSVRRQYKAVCFGFPDSSSARLRGIRGVSFDSRGVMKITTQLGRHRTYRQRQAVCFEGGRHAITHIRVIRSYGDPVSASLLNCWLETGRTHQIRVHTAYLGHGLLGDPVYGKNTKIKSKGLDPIGKNFLAKFQRQALHASDLGFVHPQTGKNLYFMVKPPRDFQKLVTALEDMS